MKGVGRKSKARNVLLGAFFFVLGVIGVLVPVMPQIPFFIMSALFFSLVFPRVRRAIWRWRKRHPKVDSAYRTWRGKARAKRRVRLRRDENAGGATRSLSSSRRRTQSTHKQ